MTATGPTTTDFSTLRWEGGIDGRLWMIDQTLLPTEYIEINCGDLDAVCEAIRALRVRGAPAIGVSAAYGVCVGLQTGAGDDRATLAARLETVITELAATRPTAVNLFWALDRMRRVAESVPADQSVHAVRRRLLDEALAIDAEDREMCRAIGRHGATLLSDGQGVLTHCNAGGLATVDYGTALAVIYAAEEAGKTLHIYADETRPLLQGARLTSWELERRGIDVTVICDSAAAHVMHEGRVQVVVTGADRIAANGDVANKIGTYSVALAAAAHDIPFYVAAPTSTFDLSLASGEEIPIELRAATEITHGFGRQTAPDGVAVYNPAFDVTPARLIRALICERGIIEPVTTERIREKVG